MVVETFEAEPDHIYIYDHTNSHPMLLMDFGDRRKRKHVQREDRFDRKIRPCVSWKLPER